MNDDRCKFSTYGYPCGKPVEHGRYLCDDHASAKCSSCGQPATHGCDFCGQFVCGAPLCDECTFGTDSSKPAGAWGFMNHIHVSKPEFADKHENARLKGELSAKDAELAKLRDALEPFARVADIFNARAGNRPTKDDDPVHEWEDHRIGVRRLTVGDFRKADVALKGERHA